MKFLFYEIQILFLTVEIKKEVDLTIELFKIFALKSIVANDLTLKESVKLSF